MEYFGRQQYKYQKTEKNTRTDWCGPCSRWYQPSVTQSTASTVECILFFNQPIICIDGPVMMHVVIGGVLLTRFRIVTASKRRLRNKQHLFQTPRKHQNQTRADKQKPQCDKARHHNEPEVGCAQPHNQAHAHCKTPQLGKAQQHEKPTKDGFSQTGIESQQLP